MRGLMVVVFLVSCGPSQGPAAPEPPQRAQPGEGAEPVHVWTLEEAEEELRRAQSALVDDPEHLRTEMDESRDVLRVIALTFLEKEYLRALRRYRGLVGENSEEQAMLKYLEARMLWRHNHFDASDTLFAEIVRAYPAEDVAIYSAEILLDSLIIQRKFELLMTTAKEMRINAPLLQGRDDFLDRLLKILWTGPRKKAEEMERNLDWEGCGDEYEKLFLDLNRQDRDEMLFNAATCWEHAGNTKRAIRLWKAFVRKYPTSRLASRARDNLQRLR
jgi:hypothetical protein